MAEQGAPDEVQLQEKGELPRLPEYYTNAVQFFVTAYDVQITNGVRYPEYESFVPVFRHHMSLQHTWVFCTMLRRLLNQYVKENGPIILPRQLVDELGLSAEYHEQVTVYGGKDE